MKTTVWQIQQRKFYISAILVFLALFLSACGESPTIAKQDETLEVNNVDNYTSYSIGTTTSYWTSIGYQSEKFCYLTSVRGNFAGDSDSAHVYNHYGSWILAVTSSSGQPIVASATCVKWSALSTPTLSPANSVKWLSSEFSSTAPFSGQQYTCTGPDTQTWWGDAATYLSGISGDLVGINGARVLQNASAFTPSRLMATWCYGNPTTNRSWAYSMFMGQPHVGDLPQFWGPKGQGVPFASAGEYTAVTLNSSPSRSRVVEMAPVDQAFCYLTHIWGNFDAAYDSVEIYPGYNSAGQRVWKLWLYDPNPVNTSSVAGLGGNVACYMLTQY